MQKQSAEELLLVPAFEESYTVRYGHIGSKPTTAFIPFVGIQDEKHGVIWGAQLECASSWKIELLRKDNGLSVSGGLADADFGSWLKNLAPGEAFTSPAAYITVCRGDVDELCARLTSAQKPPLERLPESEKSLPVLFNEWCTSSGDPSEENMLRLVETMKGWPIQYLVMDAGWFKNAEHEWFQMTGDWIPSKQKYPDGLKATCDKIRAAGMIPGIWFEIETCGELSCAYRNKDAMMLHRYGMPLKSARRKFWDFRKPEVWDYLCERVINLMRDSGIGYVKIDSNETIGAGCDGAESLGEGLRQDIERVVEFFHEMRRQIPELVIENCSSGGQRLVSNFMAASSLANFSDATESDDVPIIAANLHRVILPRQCMVWCVIRQADDIRRVIYKMASGFLGRIGLSGDVYDWDDAHRATVREALDIYPRAVDVICNGFSRRYGPNVANYKSPDGWQAVARATQRECMVVAHTFNGGAGVVRVPIGDFKKIAWSYKRDCVKAAFENGALALNFPEDFEGAVVMLEK